jgi:hypothetical protein
MKPAPAGDEPAARRGAQLREHRVEEFVGGHQSRHTLRPRACKAFASAWLFTSTYSPFGTSFAT